MAIILNLDRTVTLCTPDTHPDWFGDDGMTLAAMQAVVGGYIEHVQLHPPFVSAGVTYRNLVVNEEGKLMGLEYNPAATALALEHGLQGDVIVGVAILLTDEEFQ